MAEVLDAYLAVRRQPWAANLPIAVAALRGEGVRQPERVPPETHLLHGKRLGYAVSRTLALLPAESRCLMRSLVLVTLLSRRGIASSLVIGVRPGQRFAAHAWVEHEGEPLLPPRGKRFERLVEL